MLAKNATIFTLSGDVPGDLNQRLATRLFVEPTPSQSSASGFVVASQDYGTLTRTAGHFTEFKLRTDTKILPASVINAEAKKRAEVIEQQQGYKPGRKQMKEIKDLVEQELLATSQARTHITRGWFDTSAKLLVIDTASPAKADAVLDALCLEHIARFKRPKEYRWVEALPKNSYGKVLKTELRGQFAELQHPRLS